MGTHIEVDRLTFYGMVIEEQMAVLDMAEDMSGMLIHMEGVAAIAHEKIELAQTALDLLIEEDTTWRPA
jgi:hypothetical protein